MKSISSARRRAGAIPRNMSYEAAPVPVSPVVRAQRGWALEDIESGELEGPLVRALGFLVIERFIRFIMVDEVTWTKHGKTVWWM